LKIITLLGELEVKLFYLCALIVVTLSASSQEALNAYKSQNYKEAFRLYSQAAKSGDKDAQNALSYLYFNGLGTQKDNNKGLQWLEKAANEGSSRAALDLGIFYLTGSNVSKDLKKAAKWLEVAAEQDNSEAQYNLALMYYNGDGVKQDVKKAAALLERAAKNGHSGAKRNVGRIYMQALDFKKAKYWLRENAKDGDKEAALLLKEIEAAHKE